MTPVTTSARSPPTMAAAVRKSARYSMMGPHEPDGHVRFPIIRRLPRRAQSDAALLRAPSGQGVHQPGEDVAERGGTQRIPSIGDRFIHVAALGHFELERVD